MPRILPKKAIRVDVGTVGWGEYETAGGEVGTLLSQKRDVMEENVTS